MPGLKSRQTGWPVGQSRARWVAQLGFYRYADDREAATIRGQNIIEPAPGQRLKRYTPDRYETGVDTRTFLALSYTPTHRIGPLPESELREAWKLRNSLAVALDQALDWVGRESGRASGPVVHPSTHAEGPAPARMRSWYPCRQSWRPG